MKTKNNIHPYSLIISPYDDVSTSILVDERILFCCNQGIKQTVGKCNKKFEIEKNLNLEVFLWY